MKFHIFICFLTLSLFQFSLGMIGIDDPQQGVPNSTDNPKNPHHITLLSIVGHLSLAQLELEDIIEKFKKDKISEIRMTAEGFTRFLKHFDRKEKNYLKLIQKALDGEKWEEKEEDKIIEADFPSPHQTSLVSQKNVNLDSIPSSLPACLKKFNENNVHEVRMHAGGFLELVKNSEKKENGYLKQIQTLMYK